MQIEKQMHLNFDDFILLRQIGKGSFAEVFLIKEKKTNHNFAAKIFDLDISICIYLKREIDINSRINHPSITKFKGISINSTYPKLAMIIEYVENGSLRDQIDKAGRGLADQEWNDTTKLKAIYGIASAMAFLHHNGIIHRDLKPENILLNKSFEIKISDMGLSKFLQKNDDNCSFNISGNGFKGTLLYSSPEAISENEYTKEGDVYSFAMIVYEIITNDVAFKNISNFHKKIINGERPDINIVPEPYRNLIELAWSQDPSKRPTFDEILDELKNNTCYRGDLIDADEFNNYIEKIDDLPKEFIPQKTSGVVRIYEFITPEKETLKLDFDSSMKISDIKVILSFILKNLGNSIFLIYNGRLLNDNDSISVVQNTNDKNVPILIQNEKPEEIIVTLKSIENSNIIQIPMIKGAKGSDILANTTKILQINFQYNNQNIKDEDLFNENTEINVQLDFDSSIVTKQLNGEQLFAGFINSLRKNEDHKRRYDMIENFKELFSSNQQFADFVLNSRKGFFEFSVGSLKPDIQDEYNNLILTAHSFCSQETKENFYFNILSELTNNPIFFLDNWKNIDNFLELFEQIIPEQANKMVLLFGLENFVIIGINQYDEQFPNDQIYGKINLSKIFDIIAKYIYDNSEENNEDLFSHLINSSNFCQLTISPYHECSFNNLLFHLLKFPKNQENFIKFLTENDQSIPIHALSSMFFNVLSLDKKEIIESFFDIISQRKVKTITHFFSYLRRIINHQSFLMIKYSEIWIQKFFISTDSLLRKEIISLIQVLSSADEIEILFNSMMHSLPILDSFIDKLSDKSISQYPTIDFFNSFQNIIFAGNLIDKICCNHFIERIKKYGNKKYYIPQFHVFNFLINIYGDNLFNYVSLANLIDALGKTDAQEIIFKLPLIVPQKCDAYLKSVFYTDLLKKMFDSNVNNKIDIIPIINRIKTPENINMIVEKLFDKNILLSNIESKNFNYLKLCWKLIQEYPQISKQFYNSEAYLHIWKLLTSQSNNINLYAKMLAYFNFAFIQENKNQKSFFGNKIEMLYETYENIYFFIPNLLSKIEKMENQSKPGSGGLYHLIRSLVQMSVKPRLEFINKIKSLSNPLMTFPGSDKLKAMLICDLCLSISPSSDINAIFLREFKALEIVNESSYIAFEYFINSFMNYCPNNIIYNEFATLVNEKITNAQSIKIISRTFINFISTWKSHQFYSNDDMIKIRCKIQGMIATEVDDLIVPEVPIEHIFEITKYLNNSYECVQILTQFIGDKKPSHNIIEIEINHFIDILTDNGMEKEVNEFLSYTSLE